MSSVTFDSAGGQYAAITDGNQSGLDITGDWTIEFWAQSGTTSGTDYIVSKEDASGDHPYAVWRVTSSGIRAAIYDAAAGNTTEVEWLSVLNPDGSGDWDRFSITCDVSAADATKFELYKNAVSQGNGSVITAGGATSIYNGDGAFVVGGTTAGFNQFDGSLFDVRVWNDIRNSTEIDDNWDRTFTRPDNETGLVFNSYRAGEHHVDSSASRNDLVSNGEITWSADPGLLVENEHGQIGGLVSDNGPSASGIAMAGYPRMAPFTATYSGTVITSPPNAFLNYRMAPFTAISGSLFAHGGGTGTGGAVEYRMRGYDQTLATLVYWTSSDVDPLANDYNGPGPVVDIVVHKIVGD